jgi:hypothetical protein
MPSRKRPATEPSRPDDSLETRILRVLNDTMAARHAILLQSQQIQRCLHIADDLHRRLLDLHDDACQRVSSTSEQVSLQQLATAVGVTSNAVLVAAGCVPKYALLSRLPRAR